MGQHSILTITIPIFLCYGLGLEGLQTARLFAHLS